MSFGLSIVIPTHGRAALLERLLASINADASHLDFQIEVLLVDDSTGVDHEQLRAIAQNYGCKYISGESHVGGKRNFGAHLAQHELILFLDSDVMVCSGSLQAHYETLSGSASTVAGCLGKVEFVGKPTFAWRVISEMQLTLPFSYPDVAAQVPWGPTANISFRKAAFFSVGGFDTTLPRYGGEDVDLGLRLTKAGYQIITSREAIAEHSIETWSTWKQNLSRLISFGKADYHLLVRHPERSFIDFPTGPILWFLQAIICLTLLVIVGQHLYPWLLSALILSVLSYHFVYAFFKKRQRSSFLVHFFGPLIFYTMDMAKAYEAIRHGRVSIILRRLKFLDDLIAQDWPEIAASAWGLPASALVFAGIVMIAAK